MRRAGSSIAEMQPRDEPDPDTHACALIVLLQLDAQAAGQIACLGS
jgi:hypothetical protein